MLQRVAINDLQIGMFVEAVTKQKGAIKIKTQGRVGSQKIIEKLRQQGILELAVDPDNVIKQPKAAPEPEPVEAKEEPAKEYDPKERTSSFDQEILKASKLYTQAKKLQKKVFSDVKAGRKINCKDMETVADGFIDSVFKNQDALTCMTRIREKDAYLLEHSVNVSILMTIFAKHMKLDKKLIHELATGALLHDIGKIKIDDKVLHKPGKLTPQETIEMQRHVVHSKEILEEAGDISAVSLDIAANHHERLDGKGYPQGLSGDQVSQYARMISIVDAYDAMTADRCYKDGMNPITAFKRLMKETKTCFDAKQVGLFIQAIGVHPVGTLVKLKSQKLAIVTQTNFVDPLKPVVKVFYHAKFNHYTEIKDIDLTHNKDEIESCVKPENFKIDLGKFFQTAVLR
ncbi:MAG: HD-GYP domain-containing protein [Psychrosphaera sp.]|nr:HD-GYP domain-containing protein [Psychrosphaera sp.]